MPGFSFFYNTHHAHENNANLLTGEIRSQNFQINRFVLNKFCADKVFFESNECIILLDGILLNKQEIQAQCNGRSLADCIWHLYLTNGNEFFSHFRGSFSGLLYDKAQDKFILFSDQLGTKHLYYYQYKDEFAVSSDIKVVYQYLSNCNRKPQLDAQSAYMLLSYGYMLNGNTLCRDIKKVQPGHYILFQQGTAEVKRYYELPESVEEGTVDERDVIEQIDAGFRKAVKRQFDKDKEYKYRHFVSLSGGLDSRMTSWVAHQMGYTDQLNFTISQTGYLDETIAKSIATELRHEWIFKALDNGPFLKDVEEISAITGGNVLYYGLAHMNSLYRIINFENLGLVHTGQLGDVIIGSYVQNFSKKELHRPAGAYSTKFTKLVTKAQSSFKNFAELESELMNQRGINGANNGLLSAQWYSETMSPFYDIDFMETCFSIPIRTRMDHHIYKKWIMLKYPRASEYVWEKTKRKISSKTVYLHFQDRKIPFTQLHHAALRHIGLKKAPVQTKDNMNPLDYWYASNDSIRRFQDNYYHDNMHRLEPYPDIAEVCRNLYVAGTATEKNQVLTLLSALKLFFS